MEKITFEEFKKLALELDMQYNEDATEDELALIRGRFEAFKTLDEVLSYFSEGGLDNDETYPILLGLFVKLPGYE